MRRLQIITFAATLAACTRPEPVAEPEPVRSPSPELAPDDPVDPTPVALAEYGAGSSCNLWLDRHDEGALYWALQGFSSEPEPEPEPEAEPEAEPSSARSPAPSPGGSVLAASFAMGAVLDCSRTRGTIMRVATSGDAPAQTVAETVGWPWSLEADDSHLYWIGYCDHSLWTVAKTGGEPKPIALGALAVIDVVPGGDDLLIADRFGARTGIYALRRGARGWSRPTLAAAGDREPWLFGALESRIYWGEQTGSGWAAFVVDRGASGAGRPVALGSFVGQPNQALARDGALFVLTGTAILRLTGTDPVQTLATIEPYGDRGNLAADDGHLYVANGRAGTIARVDQDGGARREAQVGGEPCGVAVDERNLYWLDRGRERVMRAPLAIFDAPAPE